MAFLLLRLQHFKPARWAGSLGRYTQHSKSPVFRKRFHIPNNPRQCLKLGVFLRKWDGGAVLLGVVPRASHALGKHSTHGYMPRP